MSQPRKEGRKLLGGLLASVVLLAVSSLPARAGEIETLLDKAIAGDHRSEKNVARDKYRHPKETLLFFGLQPDMTVVEVWPSGGWYTEILAPVLRDKGTYYAGWLATEAQGIPDFLKQIEKGFDAKLVERPDVYGKVVKTKVLAPQFVELAPKGSADMVLTFRNVHNWAKAGNVDAMFKTFYDTLKPGGVLGVTDHRADEGTPFERQIASGYMTQSYVVDAAKKAGFQLVGWSEVNSNARDSKDHPEGVWTLPPVLRLGDKDREKYLAIGESDRMTLKFVKPK